jgi:hypothetical protein
VEVLLLKFSGGTLSKLCASRGLCSILVVGLNLMTLRLRASVQQLKVLEQRTAQLLLTGREIL